MANTLDLTPTSTPPTVNLPANQKIGWSAFTMCLYNKTLEIIAPDGTTVVAGAIKKEPDQASFQLMKNNTAGSQGTGYTFDTGSQGGDYTIKITSTPGTVQYAAGLMELEKGNKNYGNTFMVLSEDGGDGDYNDCTVFLTWTTYQG